MQGYATGRTLVGFWQSPWDHSMGLHGVRISVHLRVSQWISTVLQMIFKGLCWDPKIDSVNLQWNLLRSSTYRLSLYP